MAKFFSYPPRCIFHDRAVCIRFHKGNSACTSSWIVKPRRFIYGLACVPANCSKAQPAIFRYTRRKRLCNMTMLQSLVDAAALSLNQLSLTPASEALPVVIPRRRSGWSRTYYGCRPYRTDCVSARSRCLVWSGNQRKGTDQPVQRCRLLHQ